MNTKRLLSNQTLSSLSWQRWLRKSTLLFSLMLVLIGSGAGATTSALANDEGPTGVTADDPSLHNPSFDNHDWYEFHIRYSYGTMKGSWVPDDDNNTNNNIPAASRQDWRLWFLHGTALVETDPEATYAHSSEGVQIRPYPGHSNQVAGLYQPIYNTVPCLIYEFAMYGQSFPEKTQYAANLKVGIDQVGWHPNSSEDPAVHDNFPATTVWSAAQDFRKFYGKLVVQAEALSTKIAVFTYAHTPGDRYHRIFWDTGSLREIAPDSIVDPENPPAPSLDPQTSGVGRTTATIEWTTAVEAMGQVFYQAKPTSPEPPTSTLLLSHTVYLPLVQSSQQQEDWQSTALDTTMSFDHSMPLTGLRPDTTYEYFVASRGLSGAACETWVSEKKTFTTQP